MSQIGKNSDIPVNKFRSFRKCVDKGAFFVDLGEFMRGKIAFLASLLYNIRYGEKIYHDGNSVYEW